MPAYADPRLPDLLREACAVLGLSQMRVAILTALQARGGSLSTRELAEALPDVAQKTLLNNLRALEADGAIVASTPPGIARRGSEATTWTVNQRKLTSWLAELQDYLRLHA